VVEHELGRLAGSVLMRIGGGCGDARHECEGGDNGSSKDGAVRVHRYLLNVERQ
jgi:hypothetical protein